MTCLGCISILLTAVVCSFQPDGANDVVRDTLELSKGFQARPANLIEGKVSGIQVLSSDGSVSGDLSVYVRGLNSIRSGSQPLWVVDGMPVISAPDINPYDIESIEVLKDVSATAIYGFKGANGVILIKTKRQQGDGLRVNWHSNAVLSIPASQNVESAVALGHNHSVSVSSVNGQSLLNLSGYWRSDNDVVKGNGSNSGLLNVLYETSTNPVVWFSTNTMLQAGGSSSTTGDFGPGEPSFLPEDYDNDGELWRAFNTTSLALNITNNLSFKLNIGVDYRNYTSYVWFGNGTSRGAAVNGEACISGTSMLRYYVRPVVNWHSYLGKGRLDISAGASVNGDINRTNIMRGSDFFSHELRAKGLNIHASKTAIDNHSIDYFSHGLFASAAYSYDDFAGADAMIRFDRTKDYDDKPVLHYAINAYVKPIDGLKIKAGYGVGGFELLADYDQFGEFVSGDYPAVPPELTYYYKGLNRVTSREWNIGVEAALLEGRLNLAAKYFNKHTDDGFFAYCFGRKMNDSYLWRYAERTPFFDTTDSLMNSGVEIDADASLISREDLKWKAGLGFAWLMSSIENPLPGLLAGFNTDVRIKQFSLYAETNAAALSDADFFRFGKMGVAYDVRNIRLSLTGHNLLIFGSINGIYPGPYPYARSLVAGVTLTF